ncbi:hypothetical protein BWP39_03700 [Paraburkholderia acidicola]|uniref:DUF418 domain-containing protein n=1 Tax=Paraburkholderia acidicola TaxID=1912599 RepID=A0A2A4F2N0_9BURK|nr:hypothetical protein BWP39_03700 [Paraburkholderia acidicola]
MSSSALELDRIIAPVKAKARIQALDVIRGLSILGILAVNADGFASTMLSALNPPTWLFPNQGWTAILFWIMDAFFHDKFVTLFSMLFGVSLFLVGGERSDRQKGRLLRRRLTVLFVFGLLHGFGIWWGDILSLYAMTGAIMFFCRSWQPRTLMIVGIVLYAFMQCKELPPGALPFASPEARAQAVAKMVPGRASIARRKARAVVEQTEATSSWAGAYRENAREYLRLLSGNPSLVPATLALMMIGLALFKSGFLAARSSTRRYTTVIATGAIALAVVGWLTWQKDIAGVPVLGGDVVALLLTPVISLAYASTLILILRAGAAFALSPLAAAGRMAFTNYLTQSLIMTSIFYGGRGALMGEIDRPGLWGIVIAVWALQLIWSPLWLSRFEMGPFEWVWRCLTYGRRLPLLKQT